MLDDGAADVRKTVTVVFCDLVGSTALGETKDPEVLREMMARYHAELRAILEHHGATVEKFVRWRSSGRRRCTRTTGCALFGLRSRCAMQSRH